jgi:hypothetical protein
MPVQLRVYTITPGNLQQFAQEWQEKIRPVREKVGFSIPGAWTVAETNQFVWLMQYDDPDTWEERDQAYFNSEERRAMAPNPARLIAKMEQYFVEPVVA